VFPWLVLLGVSSVAHAAGPAASKATRELEGKVLAVLRARCVKCHGPARPKAGLALMGFDGVARGGENGPVVLPGDLEESVLWRNISEETMPPDRPLPEAERGLIRQWIEAGAPPGETVR
ncbi:MAG: c-type cytochrome domain-containing protein, partial [Singulisphaera sp.]